MQPSQKNLGYALSPHLTSIWGSGDTGWLALIDAGQIQGLATRLRTLHPPERCHALYEGTFAENVMALSPLLIELSAEPALAAQEVSRLDQACASLPIMSLIQIGQTTTQWLQHLRSLLRLQMNDTDYLWRLADTQMLQASARALTANQRATVFGACRAWWVVTSDGMPQNMASCAEPSLPLPEVPPLQLDAQQENVLLTQIAPFTLASQLRSMDQRFNEQLTHAEQSQFAVTCIHEAREAFLDEDTELLPWALSKWQEAPMP